MKKKITSYLSTIGTISTKTADVTLSNKQVADILVKCHFSKKDIEILIPENKKVFVIPNCETILTVKMNGSMNICKASTELVKLIDSNHFVFEHKESFEKNRLLLTFDCYAAMQKDLQASTAVSEALLIENVYDEKIDIIQKISLIYEKITVIFLIA